MAIYRLSDLLLGYNCYLVTRVSWGCLCPLLCPSGPFTTKWHQLPLERGAAHEPDEPRLSPSNGDKDRPRGLAIGHNFRPPAPAIGQKMLLAQDRAQAQRPACDPTGQTTS